MVASRPASPAPCGRLDPAAPHGNQPVDGAAAAKGRPQRATFNMPGKRESADQSPNHADQFDRPHRFEHDFVPIRNFRRKLMDVVMMAVFMLRSAASFA